MRTLVVTGGTLEDKFALEFLKKEKFELKIAVDRGTEFFYRNSLKPDYVVGDFDSASREIIDNYQRMSGVEVQTYPPEKNETDTEIGVGLAMEKHSSEVVILGGTGTRMDHAMANINLLGKLMEAGVNGFLVDGNNRIRMAGKSLTLNRQNQFGDYVSLVPVTPMVRGITLKGFKYPLDGYDMSRFSTIGISNEIKEEIAEIVFRDGILLVVESRDRL